MSVETESSTQRGRIFVPSPATMINVGAAGTGDTDYETAVEGITVNTAEHVRMFADGSTGKHDLVAQATGELWMRAVDDLVVRSKDKMLVASRTTNVFASGEGITVMAAFGQAPVSSNTAPGTPPAEVTSFDDKINIASTTWGVVSVATAAVTGILKTVETVVGSGFSKTAAGMAAANVAGLTLNTLMLVKRDLDLPGIHMFSNAGIHVGALIGTVNIGGLAGCYMGSLYTAATSVGGSQVRGVSRVSVTAGSHIDFTGVKAYEAKTDGAHTLAARTGKADIFGTKVRCGISVSKARLPQLPTKTVRFSALKEVTMLTLGAIEGKAGLLLESTADVDTNLTCMQETTFTVGGWEVSIKPTESKWANPQGTSMKIDASGVTLATKGGASSAKMGTSQIDFKAGSGKMTVVPGATVSFDGQEFSIK